MKTFDINELPIAQVHSILLSAITPRPIAFASTIDKQGNVNLSPFSFFNAFSANPPIVIFSPARRVRDNTTKHTLQNVIDVPEVCINIVDYPMVEQMSLSSAEYDQGINEFVKSGLTEKKCDRIAPPRVAESPVSFECKVIEVKPLGNQGGAGNLVICELLLVHIKESILNEDQSAIVPNKLDMVARMGDNWYTRANGSSMFEIPKPISNLGVGFDNMPGYVLNSSILSGNDLGRLATIGSLPTDSEVFNYANHPDVLEVRANGDITPLKQKYEELAKDYVRKGKIESAWKVLLQPALTEG